MFIKPNTNFNDIVSYFAFVVKIKYISFELSQFKRGRRIIACVPGSVKILPVIICLQKWLPCAYYTLHCLRIWVNF